jgi:hypothetical protein
MAVISGVTVVPNARIAGVALTGLHGDEAVAAVRKTLEYDGGARVLRKQKNGRGHKSQEALFHRFSHVSNSHVSKSAGMKNQQFSLRCFPSSFFNSLSARNLCQIAVPATISKMMTARPTAKVKP